MRVMYVRGRPVLASCTLGLATVYRKYCEARGKRGRQAGRQAAGPACSSNEARTLWCVLSLQWRGSTSKVQKEKTAEESGHCFTVCACVLEEEEGLCASAMSGSSSSSLPVRVFFSIQPRLRAALQSNTF